MTRAVKNSMGPMIKALRKMNNMTQAQLAQAVGLERTSITNIEGQKQMLSDLTAEAMANAMGYRIVVKFERIQAKDGT